MNKNLFYLLLISLLIGTSLNAQTIPGQKVPGGMLFQALAKDNLGAPAKDREIYALVTILKGSSTGTVDYLENFQVTAGADGIFTLIIGQGIPSAGGAKSSIYDIDWGGAEYYLNIKIFISPTVGSSTYDPNWASNKTLTDVGTSKLWTVPYTFYANRALVSDGALKLLNTLPSEMGGTGVANPTGKKITLNNSLSVKGTGDFTITTTGASNITFPTTGTMATLEGVEVFTNKTLESPKLIGIPTTPTAALTDNSNQVASNEFVQTNITNVKSAILSSTQSALNLKEDKANKSSDVSTDANSDDKYPSTKAVKSFIDKSISGITIPDATTSTKGIIQLAGDLSGSASLPTVSSVGGVSSSTISTLPTVVATNTTDIATNKTNIATNASNIEANTKAIGINSADIATNKTNIATNTLTLNNATANATPNTLVKRDEFGNFSSNVITASLAGNASTTSRLLNPVNIYGNSFNGTENITKALAPNFGGTGTDNGLSTIKLGGNLLTSSDVTLAGTSSTTIRTTNVTDVTLPTAGILSTIAGEEALINKTVNGVKPEALANGFKIAGGTSTSTTLTVIGDVTVGGVNTGDQLITLTGDVVGSGTGNINTTINSIGGVSSSTISGLPDAVLANTSAINSEVLRAKNTEALKLNKADTAAMLNDYLKGIIALNADTATLGNRFSNVEGLANTKLRIADTAAMLKATQ